MRSQIFVAVLFLALALIIVPLAFAVAPSGATVNVIKSETTPSANASSDNATAGNITAIVLYSGNSRSQTWQGYYGNVSGGIRLSDASGNVLYNWSVISAAGEIYASTNSTINWENIMCFNMTASGTYTNENGNGGTTSQYGINQTILENQFNFNSSDFDSINNTFSTKNHDLFFTSNQQFSADECFSIQLFNNESTSVDGLFEEVLLYEPDTRSVIFATLLEETQKGFDNSDVDFEMIVLEDGHGTDTATTEYFFFMEIE